MAYEVTALGAPVVHKTLAEALLTVRGLFQDWDDGLNDGADPEERPGDVVIRYVAMTSAQVDALPEFEGY